MIGRGLVNYWALQDDFFDSVGGQNFVIGTGNNYVIEGKEGVLLTNTGLKTVSNYTLNPTGFTMILQIKGIPTGADHAMICGVGNYSGSGLASSVVGFITYNDDNQFMMVDGNGYISTHYSPNFTSDWNTLVYRFDGATSYCYVNGILHTTSTSPNINKVSPLYVGYTNYSIVGSMRIKNIAIYNIALSEEEIVNYTFDLFLIKQNNQYYSIKPDFYDEDLMQYQPLEGLDFSKGFNVGGLFDTVTITKEQFRPIDKFDNFTLISENTSNINCSYQAIKSTKELIVANDDIVTNIAENIDYINVIANKIGNGLIRLAFSIDRGITWKSYNGAKFIDLSCSIPLKNYTDLTEEELVLWNIAKEEIYSNGTTIELFNSIDFNLLKSSTIRFAYVISRPTYADTAETSQLEWKFDAKGHFEKMKDSEYEIDTYKDQLKIKSKIENDIIKANLIV